MSTIRTILILLLLVTTSAFAAPASESSIKELLVITQVQKMLEGLMGQFDVLVNNSIQQALSGPSDHVKFTLLPIEIFTNV